MLLLKQAFLYLPIQYMRTLHRIIWEQTKMYLAGGLRGLSGLSHAQAPYNTERIDDELYKTNEEKWKLGVYQQSDKERESMKDWLYLVDNDPLEMTRELVHLSGGDIALIVCGDHNPGGRVEEGAFGTEEELFHRTDLKRFTDKMRTLSLIHI